MGREVRRVPLGWKHPRKRDGNLQPLMDQPFDEAIDEWIEERRKWNAPDNAERLAQEKKAGHRVPYEEWNNGPPQPEYYRPTWAPGSDTAFQVYENVTEGTPVSPVLETREELIDWLVNVGDGMGVGGVRLQLSQKAAERFADSGYAPSMIVVTGGPMAGIYPGVAAPAPKK